MSHLGHLILIKQVIKQQYEGLEIRFAWRGKEPLIQMCDQQRKYLHDICDAFKQCSAYHSYGEGPEGALFTISITNLDRLLEVMIKAPLKYNPALCANTFPADYLNVYYFAEAFGFALRRTNDAAKPYKFVEKDNCQTMFLVANVADDYLKAVDKPDLLCWLDDEEEECILSKEQIVALSKKISEKYQIPAIRVPSDEELLEMYNTLNQAADWERLTAPNSQEWDVEFSDSFFEEGDGDAQQRFGGDVVFLGAQLPEQDNL